MTSTDIPNSHITFPFLGVDWGTTRMRAMLFNDASKAFDPAATILGPGISRLQASPADTLFGSVGGWVEQYGKLDVLVSGMAGSNIGWRETSYLSCPISTADVRNHLVQFEEQGHRVSIVPGVSCTNSIGQPDIMRGEEVQILGWQLQNQSQAPGDALLCLPGTHTKWGRMAGRKVAKFTTSITGELFDLLRRHSVLVPKGGAGDSQDFDAEAFRQGVDIAHHYGDDLLHVVFSTRSRSIIGGYKEDAASFLSGILIGADLRSAIRSNEIGAAPIHLIGSAELCKRFAMAIEQLGHVSEFVDGDAAVHAGFLAIAQGAEK